MRATIKNLVFPFALQELVSFIDNATLNTYAAEKVDERAYEASGYKILRYKESNWDYEDKYTGYFRSFGSETVRYNNEIIWKVMYGGGMLDEYLDSKEFAAQTYEFLKTAMRENMGEDTFNHRGPKNFELGEWQYKSKTNGDITSFYGEEKISYRDEVVFFHKFIGGLVIDKNYIIHS